MASSADGTLDSMLCAIQYLRTVMNGRSTYIIRWALHTYHYGTVRHEEPTAALTSTGSIEEVFSQSSA